MKPIKITIEGDYIDCQLYRGRLYLWKLNGSLCVYDWDLLVDYFVEVKCVDRTAFLFAFNDGRSLYVDPLHSLFQDDSFRSLLLSKFTSLEPFCFYLKQDELNHFLIEEIDVPIQNLPIDTEIYSNELFFVTDDGLFKSPLNFKRKKKKYSVSSGPKKLWDARILSIKANSFPQIALSAGSDGLFEFNNSQNQDTLKSQYEEESVEDRIFKISSKHSSFANYANLSIYSTSLYGESFMAYFDWDEGKKNEDIYLRKLQREYSESDIFKNDSKSVLSWGFADRIIQLTDEGFKTIIMGKSILDERKVPLYSVSGINSNVISGTSTYFGNIVEYTDSLLIVQTDNECFTINGPITRWRVYPRSRNYKNQLHVILDDCLEIYAFNHDFFLPQTDKQVGVDFVDNEKVWRINRVA